MDVNQQGTRSINLVKDTLGERCQHLFCDFLEGFEEDGEKKYFTEGKKFSQAYKSTLVVSFKDVEEYNRQLADTIHLEYYRVYPYLCMAVDIFVNDRVLARNSTREKKRDFFVSFVDVPHVMKVRQLRTARIGTLMTITGQVVRTHPTHPELISGSFICLECQTVIKDIKQQFKYTEPTICRNPACNNRRKFFLDANKSKFGDFQKVRIQETQSELPRGSIPRSIDVVLRAERVDTAQAGDRCDFTGTLIVVPDVASMAFPGVRAESGNRLQGGDSQATEGVRGLKSLGVRDLTYKLTFLACSVTPSVAKYGGLNVNKEDMSPEDLRSQMTEAENNRLEEMSQDKHLYHNLCDSLFPTIYGNDEVKKGVLLMLFGGVPKVTTEETRLRGDINVCVVGDPSTAKSQFLKLVEGFSPRAIYTSGKASTAAGLTAAVVKDEETHEFVIEAGALMLSDNGVCCIDEFDKMDPRDQVAIHEAMEQQTISITKAGVKATLNARTSVLAAANPIGGRYDKSKSLRQNIAMTAPIMSRFDLFFVLVDECNEIADYAIARRIISLHQRSEEMVARVYSLDEIQRYITCAKFLKPKVARSSVDMLVSLYKDMRQNEQGSSGMMSSRITARQLESMIRLSEALARMHFELEVLPKHIKEAHRLLSKSIIRVERPDVCFDEDAEPEEEVMEVEEESAGKKAEPKKNAGSLKMSYDEYRKMANMLIVHMHQREESEDSGVTMASLVNWYLKEIEEEIDSEEELLMRKNIVEKVINQLINHDHVIIKLTQTGLSRRGDGASAEEDPILVIHPNYVIEM